MNGNLIRGTIIWGILVITLVSLFIFFQVWILLVQQRAANDPYDPDKKVIVEPLYQPN